MKLIDAEVTIDNEGAQDIPRAPRPARRRVYTSLVVTLSVLFGTVGVIYTMFPNRQDEILTLAMQAHQEPSPSMLDAPTNIQVRAWSLGVFGEAAPWPEAGQGLKPIGASLVRVFKRDIAVVRYDLDGEEVSLAVLRARDVPPRKTHRTEEGLHAISWRQKRFTTIAIGDAKTKKVWAARLGAP